uniref:SAM domain-containing protein n=2 Tax=Lutzomyia longipalpis TaxID=7200 RepID=A0A1B0CUP4_LUTLO
MALVVTKEGVSRWLFPPKFSANFCVLKVILLCFSRDFRAFCREFVCKMDNEDDRECGGVGKAPEGGSVKKICVVKVPSFGPNPISAIPASSSAATSKSGGDAPAQTGTLPVRTISSNFVAVKAGEANKNIFVKDGNFYMKCPNTNKLLRLQVAKTIPVSTGQAADLKLTSISVKGLSPREVLITKKPTAVDVVSHGGGSAPVVSSQAASLAPAAAPQVFKPIAKVPLTATPIALAKPQPEGSGQGKVEVRSIQITNFPTGTILDFKGTPLELNSRFPGFTKLPQNSPPDAQKGGVYNVQISNGRLSDPHGPIKMLGMSGKSLTVTRDNITITSGALCSEHPAAPKDDPVGEKTPRKVTRSSSTDDSPPRKPLTPRRLSEPTRGSLSAEMTPKVEEKPTLASLFCDESMENSSEGEKSTTSPHEAALNGQIDPLAPSDSEPPEEAEREIDESRKFIPPPNLQLMKLNTRREGEDEDALNLIRWEDGVGYLYMSNLHFQFNELGIVDIMDEDEYMRYQQTDSPYDHPLYEREINPLRMRQMQASGEPVYTCLGCTCFGLAADFLEPNYCSKVCINVSRKRTRVNVNEGQSSPKKKQKDGRGAFPWKDYLEVTNSQRAPDELFPHCRPEVVEYNEKHPFQEKTKFEAIDPDNCSVFSVVTVLATQGHRMLLHFDGCPVKYDFWVNFSCPDIFPPRWAVNEGKNLLVPRGGKQEMFFWKTYLRENKAEGAKVKNFRHIALREFLRPHDFKIGMKLEAENVKGTGRLTVATVADVIGNRVRIHFDGNSDNFDYWCDYDSPRLHPINYHKTINEQLITPTSKEDRPPRAFQKGMKIEAVDRVCPEFIRPATVIDVAEYELRILYDGFETQYAYWVDDDSTDIFPTGYCEITGHPLEAVPSTRWPTQNVRRQGEYHNQLGTNHDTAIECPYNTKNYNHRAVKPSRLNAKQVVTDYALRFSLVRKRKFGVEEEKPPSSSTSKAPPVTQKRPRKTAHAVEAMRKAKSAKIVREATPQPSTSQATDTTQATAAATTPPGAAPGVWKSTSRIKAHVEMGDKKQINPLLWTTNEVANFLSNLPNCSHIADKFRINDIDGEAFLALTKDDLTQSLDIKLGPAIKLYNLIVKLRTDIKEQFLQF